MSYGNNNIGKISMIDFDNREKAEQALDVLRNVGGFEIKNGFENSALSIWERIVNFFEELFDTDSEYTARVFCNRSKALFDSDRTRSYRLTIIGDTVEDVERAKSHIDKLS